MDAGHATREAVRGIEEGGVAVGYLRPKRQQRRRDFPVRSCTLAPVEQVDRLPCPTCPVTKQTAGNAQSDLTARSGDGVFGQKICDNIIIVARIEGYLLSTTGFGQ